MVFTVLCFLFNGFEMLDAFGPLEMFACANKCQAQEIKVVTVAFNRTVHASMGSEPFDGPKVTVDCVVETDELPECIDLFLIPGGRGTRADVENDQVISWIKSVAERSIKVMTVCTGSALLARTGLLDGLRATSNKIAFDWVKAQGLQVQWVERARFVLDGKFATSSGVSAGTDLACALIKEIFGDETAKEAARRAEYVANVDPDNDPFAP